MMPPLLEKVILKAKIEEIVEVDETLSH